MSVVLYINGIGYRFENDEDLLELLNRHCDCITKDIGSGNTIVCEDGLAEGIAETKQINWKNVLYQLFLCAMLFIGGILLLIYFDPAMIFE